MPATPSRWLRWIPAAAVPALIAAGVLATGATAEPTTPPATAEQVLALALSPAARQFSGTLEQRSELGIPSLPAGTLGSGGSGPEAALLGLLTQPHTAKVYADGPTRARIQVLDQMAERDVVRNGADVWTYDSKTKDVTHAVLPAAATAGPGAGPALTPDEAARRFLAATGPSTSVTLGSPVTVAGHAAYTLVLTPLTSATTVASVTVAVESRTGLPLAVDVYAKDQSEPAFQTAFTRLELRAPDASVFAFVPPPGASLTQKSLPAPDAGHPAVAPTAPAAHTAGPAKTWDAIAVVPASEVPPAFGQSPLIQQLAVPVPGGRLLASSLVNILIADDGRVLAGAVPASALEAAAAR